MLLAGCSIDLTMASVPSSGLSQSMLTLRTRTAAANPDLTPGIIGLGFWSNAAYWKNTDTWNNGEETDTSPPVLNPPSFTTLPYASSSSTITMRCATSLDATLPIEYYFTEKSGNPGGSSSGWQTSSEYTDTGVSALMNYSYTCKTRDSAIPPNEGSESAQRSVNMPLLTMPWISREAANGTTYSSGGNPGDWTNSIYNDTGAGTGSWAEFMTPKIADAYSKGFRVWLLHRPYGEGGTTGGANMHFDSRVIMEETFTSEQNHLNEEFPGWVSDVLAAYPELHLVCYMGSTRQSVQMQALKTAGNQSAWEDRFDASIGAELLGNTRISLFFDYISEATEASWDWAYLRDFAAANMTPYGQFWGIESIPKLADSHLHIAPSSLCVEGSYLARKADAGANERYFSPNGSIRWQNRNASQNSKLWRQSADSYDLFVTDCVNSSPRTTPCMDWLDIDWTSTTGINHIVHNMSIYP